VQFDWNRETVEVIELFQNAMWNASIPVLPEQGSEYMLHCITGKMQLRQHYQIINKIESPQSLA